MAEPASPGRQAPSDQLEEGELTFEQAYSELEKTVAALQQGQLSLDDTLRLYERGSHLARYCRETLESVELKVSQLLAHANGAFTTKPITSEKDVTPLEVASPAPSTSPPASPERPAPEAEERDPDYLREQRELFD